VIGRENDTEKERRNNEERKEKKEEAIKNHEKNISLLDFKLSLCSECCILSFG
jgi:hypothetical protein